MSEHGKKMIAPIVVAAILVIYLVAYFGFIVALVPGIWKILFAVVPVLLGAVSIGVCVERIKEIRSGEEDDISKY